MNKRIKDCKENWSGRRTGKYSVMAWQYLSKSLLKYSGQYLSSKYNVWIWWFFTRYLSWMDDFRLLLTLKIDSCEIFSNLLLSCWVYPFLLLSCSYLITTSSIRYIRIKYTIFCIASLSLPLKNCSTFRSSTNNGLRLREVKN